MDDKSRKRAPDVVVGGDANNVNVDANNVDAKSAATRDLKRRQIQQSNWGLREVLAECGLAELFVAPPSSSSDGESRFFPFLWAAAARAFSLSFFGSRRRRRDVCCIGDDARTPSRMLRSDLLHHDITEKTHSFH